MSLRSKTQKAKKFGTPTETTAPAPKAPSPRATGGTPTAPSSTTAPTRPTTTRKTITPTPAGIAAQEQFKSQIQTLTAPIRNIITTLQKRLTTEAHQGARLQGAAYTLHLQKEKETVELIRQKEAEIIEVELGANVKQIIESIETGKVLAPDYFHNNIIWVQSGQISNKAFLDSYYYLSNQGIIHSAPIEEIIEEIIEEPIIEEPIIELPELLPEVSAEPDITITDNMVTQQVINFNIVNGRAVGSIKFVATNNFNPFYYGKNIFNIIQIKDPNGVNILTTVKENRLNFTETERDEVLTYNEDMQGNTRATVESFVWSSATQPTAFSKMYSIEISEAEPPKPITTGFMGAGIAGAIAGLVLIGFIADHKRGK